MPLALSTSNTRKHLRIGWPTAARDRWAGGDRRQGAHRIGRRAGLRLRNPYVQNCSLRGNRESARFLLDRVKTVQFCFMHSRIDIWVGAACAGTVKDAEHRNNTRNSDLLLHTRPPASMIPRESSPSSPRSRKSGALAPGSWKIPFRR
jgi:hypothetical protein